MRILTIIWIQLASTATCHCSNDSGFDALAHAFQYSDPCSACASCGNPQESCTPDCGRGNRNQTCCDAPPFEDSLFPVEAISKTPVVTTTCFQKARNETYKLLDYLERCFQETKCTKLCKAMKSMRNYAHFYSRLFERNLCHFQPPRVFNARAVLRVNEAMLSILSNMASIAKPFAYNLRMTDCCTACDDGPSIIARTVQVYTKIVGAVLSRVTQYLFSQPIIFMNDATLRFADNIAIVAIQLSAATADLLKSVTNCSKHDYCEPIGFFKNSLETLDEIADNLESVQSASVESALALVLHNIAGLTYEVRLNASIHDIKANGLEFNVAYEVAQVYKYRDTRMRSVTKNIDTLEGCHAEILRKEYPKLIEVDIQLFEKTTALMSQDRPAQKLALEMQSMMQVYFLEFLNKTPVKSLNYEILLHFHFWLDHYANRVLDMVQYDNPEEISEYAVPKNVKNHVVALHSVSQIVTAISYVEVLTSSIMPATGYEQGMPKGHFARYRPIIRGMVMAAENLFGRLYFWPRRLRRNLLSMRKLTKTSWKFLYHNNTSLCENHDCFQFQYIRSIFEGIRLLAKLPSESQRVYYLFVEGILSENREFLLLLLDLPHSLNQADARFLLGLQEKFTRMLSNPAKYKENFRHHVGQIGHDVVLRNTEYYYVLKFLLKAMSNGMDRIL